MANNTLISTAARNAALDAVTALLNGGTIEIYNGTQPAGPGTAVGAQTKLVTLTLNATAFAAASGGSAAANSITSGTAIASSTATWARWISSGATAVMDCSVAGSGADLNLDSGAVITSGNTVAITSYTLTHPA